MSLGWFPCRIFKVHLGNPLNLDKFIYYEGYWIGAKLEKSLELCFISSWNNSLFSLWTDKLNFRSSMTRSRHLSGERRRNVSNIRWFQLLMRICCFSSDCNLNSIWRHLLWINQRLNYEKQLFIAAGDVLLITSWFLVWPLSNKTSENRKKKSDVFKYLLQSKTQRCMFMI